MALTRINNQALTNVTSAGLPAGSVVQMVEASSSTAVTINSTTYTTIISAKITPKNANNKILMWCSSNRDNSTATAWNWYSFFRDSTRIGAQGIDQTPVSGTGYNSAVSHQAYDHPNSTSEITYSFQAKQGGGTTTWGESSSGHSIILMEIAG